MDENLSLRLIRQLSASEQTALGKLLQSPFFTNKTHLYPLFLELRKPSDSIEKKRAFKRMFPEKTYDAHVWNKALSDLNGLIRTFLAVSEAQAAPGLWNRSIVSAYAHHADFALLQKAISDAVHELDNHPDSPEHWQERFWLEKQRVAHAYADQSKVSASTFEQMERYLDAYYCLSKLQLACNRISRANYMSIAPADKTTIEALLDQARCLQNGEMHLLGLYSRLLQMLISVRFDALQVRDFCALVFEKTNQIDGTEAEALVRYLFNYCTHWNRLGAPEAFDAYQQVFQLAYQHQLFDARASEHLLLNHGIMLSSGPAKQFERFVAANVGKIPEERREDAQALLSAYEHFHHGRFLEADAQLPKVKNRQPHYSIRLFSLTARVGYELFLQKEAPRDEALARAERLEQFVRRKESLLSQTLAKSYIELAWFIREMLKPFPDANLNEKIKARQPATAQWIATKIAEMPSQCAAKEVA